MDFDFTPYFEKYEALVSQADGAFERVKQTFAQCVKCEEKCADCCFALFDLTLIEALYISHKFNEKVKGSGKAGLLEKANQADRKINKLKRNSSAKLTKIFRPEKVKTKSLQSWPGRGCVARF